ncbi:MAG: TonB family protein [Chlorobi bacterium]|nr:TonB family protein [Chlorobiota bacterium]
MKNLVYVIIIATILFSCNETKVKIIHNYDLEYYSENNVKIPAILKDATLENTLNQKIAELLKEYSKKSSNKFGLSINWRLYINKDGKVDFIKDLGNKYNPRIVEDQNSTFSKKILNRLLPEIEKWEFTPAKLFDNNVNSSIDLTGLFAFTPQGDVKIYRPIKFNTESNQFVEYFVAVEQMPSPIGGIKAIQENIVYPEIAKRAGIEGRVFVKAYIDSTGTVTKTELLRGIGSGCDEAAMNAVKKVKFKPGRQRGKAVNVQVTVPILFKLSNGTENSKNSESEDQMFLTYKGNINQNGLSKLIGRIISANEGMPIAAANVLLVGTKFGAATDNNGEFSISKIPPGEYLLQVFHPTYGKHDLGKVYLKPDINTFATIKIKKGS